MSNERIHKCETEGIVSREYDIATHDLDAGELRAAHQALQTAGLADEEWTFENDGYGVLTVRNPWAERTEPAETEYRLLSEQLRDLAQEGWALGDLHSGNIFLTERGWRVIDGKLAGATRDLAAANWRLWTKVKWENSEPHRQMLRDYRYDLWIAEDLVREVPEDHRSWAGASK